MMYKGKSIYKGGGGGSPVPPPSDVSLIAGVQYHTVKINDQIWMKENLRCVLDNGFRWYSDDPEDYCIGGLYARSSFGDLRSKLSDGWRIPSMYDWDKLLNYVYDETGDTNTAYYLKSNSFGGNDQFGLNIYGAGYYDEYGDLYDKSYAALWETWPNTNDHYYIFEDWRNEYFYANDPDNKSYCSIRLVKDV